MLSSLRDFPARFQRVTSHTRYVPQIDGLRFLAIMPVLFWHAGLRGVRFTGADQNLNNYPFRFLMPNGRIGVELFFFISGYIIAYPFLIGRAPTLGGFFRRRLLRIEPPYVLVMIGCFLALSLSSFRPQHAPGFQISSAPLWQSLLASLGYAHVLLLGREPALNPPAWSLEVEVQFYVLSPFLLSALMRLRSRSARRVLVGFACAATLLLASYLLQDRAAVSRLTLPGHIWAFLLGILTSDFASTRSPFAAPAQRRWDLFLIAGLLCMAYLGLLEDQDWPFDFLLWVNLLKAASIVAIYMGAARGVVGRRVMGSPWVALIGGACYSIYLTHVPVIQAGAEILFRVRHPAGPFQGWIMSLTVLVPFATAVGLLFYALVERPCMEPDWSARLLRRLRHV